MVKSLRNIRQFGGTHRTNTMKYYANLSRFFREKVLNSQKRFDIVYDKLFFGTTVYRNAI